MMNLNEKLEIAKRLRLSTETELSRDDLEKLLEEELAKPEAEMDAELVQMILEVLEDEPTKEQQQESWQQIDKKLTAKRHWFPAMNGLAKIAAALVLLVALTFATYGTAQAFNWEFLLRLMKPVAETFMLYLGDTPVSTTAPIVSEVYDDVVLSFDYADFATLSDCPDTFEGSPVKPMWLPERFAYLQGSMYSDMHMTVFNHCYISESTVCIVDITVFHDTTGIYSHEFERTLDETSSLYVAGYPITLYWNTDNVTLSASWVTEIAQYQITGPLTEAEMIQIIESLMNISGENK